MPVVAVSRGERVLDLVRWGLVPSWAKNLAIGDQQINARADTVATKPAYKRAFVKRRAIIPADGFYEWQPIEGQKKKQPWFIRRRDGEPLAFAGLWEIWHDPEIGDDAPRVRSCVIITTDANDVLAPIHDRMPVVLAGVGMGSVARPRVQRRRPRCRSCSCPRPTRIRSVAGVVLVNKADNNGPELLEEAEVASA